MFFINVSCDIDEELFIQIYECDMARFSLHRCNRRIFVRKSSDIRVTGCCCVESLTFVRKQIESFDNTVLKRQK